VMSTFLSRQTADTQSAVALRIPPLGPAFAGWQ
jgi:hypothetical protein